MGILSLLAVEAGGLAAEGLEEGGFGLNFDLLDTNLINLAIIIAALVYFGRKFLGNTLAERRSQIESAIKEAEQRKRDAASQLAEQQQRLAQAQTDAARLLKEAETRAEAARQAILAQAEQDIVRLREAADQDTSSQRERIVAELRQRVTEMALQRAEERLRSELDEGRQHQLISRSIDMLGGQS
ncbi:MAG: F0F1 ATP synthase subunit B [Synechococcales bacterium]|nr:F0F1 ATP synthase subunit B [Synechococcales bacterium]